MVLCLICASYPKNPNKREMGREKTFLRGTLANNLFLKKLHFRYQMNEGISAEQHLKHMKDMSKEMCGKFVKKFRYPVFGNEARKDAVSLYDVKKALIHEEVKHVELLG